MSELDDAMLGHLTKAIATAFETASRDFWGACRKQDTGARNNVAPGPFEVEVGDALVYLNGNAQAEPLLGDLLLARPGDAELRNAVRLASPQALAAVSDLRFEIEQKIGTALTSGQAQALRDNLGSIDELMKAVTAYKSMHDSLHVLQPLLPLLQGAAAKRERWPELRAYPNQFRLQLRTIARATSDLASVGRDQQLGFRSEIDSNLALLDSAINAGVEYDVSDAASEIASLVGRGLDTVDVLMLAAAEEASAPLGLAVEFLTPLVDTARDTHYGPLVAAYVEFARQMSLDLSSAIQEHGRWQQLDRQFELLHRAVVENQPAPPGDIERIWRLAVKQLDALCAGPPPPLWAIGIVTLLGSARSDLMPPISPPLDDAVRDRVSALISDGRNRFMAVDEALLDWLGRSVSRQPQLVSILKGEVVDG